MKDCANHRMIIVSSELVWRNNKYQYGEPVAQVVTYKCLCCNHINVITFKD